MLQRGDQRNNDSPIWKKVRSRFDGCWSGAGPRFRLLHVVGVPVATSRTGTAKVDSFRPRPRAALRVLQQDVGGEAAMRRWRIHGEIRPGTPAIDRVGGSGHREGSLPASNPPPIDVQRTRPEALRQLRVGHALPWRDGEEDWFVGRFQCRAVPPAPRCGGFCRWRCNIHGGVARLVGTHRGIWKLMVFPPTDTAGDFRSDYFTLSPRGLVDGL